MTDRRVRPPRLNVAWVLVAVGFAVIAAVAAHAAGIGTVEQWSNAFLLALLLSLATLLTAVLEYMVELYRFHTSEVSADAE